MTGAKVKEIRAQLGLTQAEFATRLNATDRNLKITASTVSRWESGKHQPSAHVVAALRQIAPQATSGQPIALTLTDITCPGCGQVAFFREYGDARYERPILIANDDPASQPTLAPIARTTRLMPTNIECYGCGYRLSDDHATKLWDAIYWSPDDALADGYSCIAIMRDGKRRDAILTTDHAASSYGQPVALIGTTPHGSGDVAALDLGHAHAAIVERARGAGYRLA